MTRHVPGSGGPGRWGRQAAATVREALAAARSQPVASAVTIAMIAGLCAAVSLTTGRTVGAEQAALAQVDAEGTRLIVVRASNAEAGLDASVLDRLAHIDGIEAVAGFGEAFDARNALIAGATKVPIRTGYGQLEGIDPGFRPLPGIRSAFASDTAAALAGFTDGVGGLTATDGRDIAVVGQIRVPPHLAFLEPLIVIPADADPAPAQGRRPLSVLVVVPTRPDLVQPLTEIVRSTVAVDNPKAVTVSTSETLANVRAAIEGRLGSYGRSLVVGIVGIAGLLVAANLYGVVTARRKDFGRRRALGATRGLIITLLLTQVLTLALIGTALGTLAALIALRAVGDPLPPPAFLTAIGILAVATALLAALVPAIAAARRDPIKELRVP